MKYDETNGAFSVFCDNANYANGNTRDRQGRLITCEHSITRRITRTEHNGKITVLADSYEGKRLNAPNDIVVKSDDSIWFTARLFGINGEWEGSRAKPEQATTNVYRLGTDGKLWCGWGSNGSPQGKAIGFIKLPERCANLAFGGPKNNRLYMASCHSLYALYVEAHGAV